MLVVRMSVKTVSPFGPWQPLLAAWLERVGDTTSGTLGLASCRVSLDLGMLSIDHKLETVMKSSFRKASIDVDSTFQTHTQASYGPNSVLLIGQSCARGCWLL